MRTLRRMLKRAKYDAEENVGLSRTLRRTLSRTLRRTLTRMPAKTFRKTLKSVFKEKTDVFVSN